MALPIWSKPIEFAARSSARSPQTAHFPLRLKMKIFSGTIAAEWIATRNSLQVLCSGNYSLQLLIVPSGQCGRWLCGDNELYERIRR